MDRPIVALILAGGTGTRLYPASRSDRPKQFMSFGGEGSLLERTVERAGFADEVYVLTRSEFADGVRERVPSAAVLTEPEPKDTGPALVYAAHRVREQVGDCVLVCLPSDHHVEGDFAGVAHTAAEVAVETDGLVTIGIEPSRPAPGYGYVEPAETADPGDGYAAVAQFHEKPDRETAAEYVERGWYWNAGIFAWTPAALLREARETVLAPLADALEGDDPAAGFAAVDAVSVDYAIMEHTDDAYVVPADVEWDDLGTWDAVGRQVSSENAIDGNAILGDALAIDAADNVVATDGHVSLVGVDDLIVASYDDRTLVVPRDRADDVRAVVERLRTEELF